ncbi:MAG: hypothetical protein RLZZ536_2524 [Planctomycetota bacterium]
MFRWFRRTHRSIRHAVGDWFAWVQRKHLSTVRASFAWLMAIATVREVPSIVKAGDNRPTLSFTNYLNPIFWVVQAAVFVYRYLGSRLPANLIQGTPALVGILCPVVIGFWVAPTPDQMISRARARLQREVEQRNFKQAEFYANLWQSYAPYSNECLLEKALIWQADGRADDCRALLLVLADVQNFPPALMQLCSDDLRAALRSADGNSAGARELEPRLLRLAKMLPNDSTVDLMLGTYYMMNRQDAQALPLLQRVTSSLRAAPEAWYSLALVNSRLSRPADARAAAGVSADLFLERDAREGYNRDRMLQTVRALVMAQREEHAVRLVEGALVAEQGTEALRLRAALAEICANWASRLRQESRGTPQETAFALEVLARGLNAAPNNPFILDEFTRFALRPDAESPLVDERLNQLLDNGVQPGVVHFILGTRALQAERPDSAAAEHHFRVAMEHNAAFPGLLNNLADSIANSEDGDYEEGLRLVGQAISLMPDQPYFFDTRGKLLLRTGRIVEAIADFERALQAVELRSEVHNRIADCYEKLGQAELTRKHRRLSEQFRALPIQQ